MGAAHLPQQLAELPEDAAAGGARLGAARRRRGDQQLRLDAVADVGARVRGAVLARRRRPGDAAHLGKESTGVSRAAVARSAVGPVPGRAITATATASLFSDL